MKYPELEEPCKSAIAKGICTGCNLLELPYFRSKKDCKYAKQPSAEESIRECKKILGIQQEMKI